VLFPENEQHVASYQFQLARTLVCNHHDSILKRELQELRLANAINRKFGPQELLTIYLNRVYLRYSGRKHVVLFEGVQAVEMNQPEGMLLYSASEMRASPPRREFVLTNNEEKHPGYLSILCDRLFCTFRLILRRILTERLFAALANPFYSYLM
jgi:hypothetical protein